MNLARIFPLALALTWLSLVASAQADEPTDAVQITDAELNSKGFLVHRVRCPQQSGETLVRVLLPKAIKAGEKYPVVYVLPVEAKSQSRYGDGLVEVKSLDLHNRFQAIFVAPTFSHLPWFADHPNDARIQQESYFTKVVIPFVERQYPAKATRDGRLLLGFSKSGYGAWTLLLRNPKLFARAAAWDAPMMMQKVGKYGNGPIYGTQANFERYRITDLLQQHAGEFADQPARLILTGVGNFVSEHVAVHKLMESLKITHVYRDMPKRKHDWHSGWVKEAVELLFQ